jgi:PAS domain S-box-containing protein
MRTDGTDSEGIQKTDDGVKRGPSGPPRPRPLFHRFAGLFLTLAVIVVIELLVRQGISIVAPSAALLLAVALSATRGGTLIGLVCAGLAGDYFLYVMTVTPGLESGTPLMRTVTLFLALVGIAIIGGRVRQRLDRVMEAAIADRTSSERRLAGALKDIERAQGEVRLQARLLDAVGQAVIATDRNGHIQYGNRAAAAIYGWGDADMRGARITDVAPAPDPVTNTDETLDRLNVGNAWTGESVIPGSDNTRLPVLVTDSPLFDDRRRLAGMVRVVIDLSPRRQAENAQRLLADAGDVLAGSVDYAATFGKLSRLVVPDLADCCMVDVLGEDGELERLEVTHIDPEKEALARQVRLRYPLSLASSYSPIAEAMRTGRPQLMREVSDAFLRQMAQDDQHYRMLQQLGYHSAMAVPLLASGTTLGALAFFTADPKRQYDTADLSLAEELARRASLAIEHAKLYEEALLANQAKSDFLAVMSHELRTPLTTVMGYADLLLGGLPEPIGERAHLYVQRLRSAAAHLLGLIDQILVYTRLEVGRADIHADRLGVGDLLREAAALIEPVAAERGIVFRVEPTDPAIIETDLTKLRQILLNLLANAVKFTDQGEVILNARSENGTITFSVRDTGIGIAPEHLEKVFDPFWQVDQSSTRRVGGTGLGLSVSRRLARFLGGDVTVESTPGSGTVFHLTLPERWPEERGYREDVPGITRNAEHREGVTASGTA